MFLPSATFQTEGHFDQRYYSSVSLVVALLEAKETAHWNAVAYGNGNTWPQLVPACDLGAEFDDNSAHNLAEMLTRAACSYQQIDDLIRQVVVAMQQLGRLVSPNLSNWGTTIRLMTPAVLPTQLVRPVSTEGLGYQHGSAHPDQLR